MNQDIINFIKESRVHDVPDAEIKQELLSAGWEAHVVEDNFVHLKAITDQPLSNKDEDILVQRPSLAKPFTENPHLSSTIQKESGVADASSQTAAVKPKTRFKKTLIALFIFLMLLGGAGFYAYSVLGFYNPDKIWKNFWLTEKNDAYAYNLKLSYQDKSESNAPTAIKIFIDGYENQTGPTYELEAIAGLDAKTKEFNTNRSIKLLVLNEALYLDLSSIPEILQGLGNNESGWVKIDLKGINEAFKKSSLYSGQYDALNTALINDLKNLFTKNNPIKKSTFAGIEKVSGANTLRFKNELDKDVLAKLVIESLKIIMKANASQITKLGSEVQAPNLLTEEALNKVEEGLKKQLDLTEFKQFDTWIGIFNSKTYKTKLITSAPSLGGPDAPQFLDIASLGALGTARAKSRDAKRLADVRLMAAALELYFNVFSRYPDSKEGQAIGLVPNFILTFPISPLPSDGNCTDYFNTFWYEQKNAGASFELSFCLGSDAGGYASGINKLTPAGIEKIAVCPSTPENCVKPTGNANLDLLKENYGAEFEFEITYSNFGKTKVLKAPENALDILQVFGSLFPK